MQILWFMPFFYFSIGVVLLALFKIVAGLDWRRCFGAVAMGIALGLFPPLIDAVVYGIGTKVVYSYNFFADVAAYPWFFYSGPEAIPAGECVSVWMSVLFAGIYTYLAGRNILRAVLVSLVLFVIFHMYMSGIPIVTAAMVLGKLPDASMTDKPTGHVINAVTFFFAFWYIGIALVAAWVLRPSLLRIFWRRLLHILPFTLISLIGSALAHQPAVESALNAVSLSLLFYIAAVENDYYDALFEKGTNRTGVNRNDISFLRVIALMIISWLAFLGQVIGLLYLLVYLAAVIYHMPEYRARRYFAAGMKIEGAWGWLAFTSGTLLRPAEHPNASLVYYGIFVFLGWSLLSVLKDLKDLRRDKKSGSESLYLFLRRKGWSFAHSQVTIKTAIFVSLCLPIAFFALRGGWFAALGLAAMNIALLILNSSARFFRHFRWHLAVISAYLGFLLYWSALLQ